MWKLKKPGQGANSPRSPDVAKSQDSAGALPFGDHSKLISHLRGPITWLLPLHGKLDLFEFIKDVVSHLQGRFDFIDMNIVPWVVATQIFFIFTPIWGRFPIWPIFFKGVVQPPSRYLNFMLNFDFQIFRPRKKWSAASTIHMMFPTLLRWIEDGICGFVDCRLSTWVWEAQKTAKQTFWVCVFCVVFVLLLCFCLGMDRWPLLQDCP